MKPRRVAPTVAAIEASALEFQRVDDPPPDSELAWQTTVAVTPQERVQVFVFVPRDIDYALVYSPVASAKRVIELSAEQLRELMELATVVDLAKIHYTSSSGKGVLGTSSCFLLSDVTADKLVDCVVATVVLANEIKKRLGVTGSVVVGP